MNKHIHYDTIIAWANGETIQIFQKLVMEWVDLDNTVSPTWFPNNQYRVKPKEVKLVPHWPAVVDFPLRLSARLFTTKGAATAVYQRTIRLATEYPPVMLPEPE